MDGYFYYITNKLEAIRLGQTSGRFDIVGELKSYELWRAVSAEFIATMLFVFIGTMSAVTLDANDDVMTGVVDMQGTQWNITMSAITDPSAKYVKIGLTFGFMITVCVQMFGHVSGGHMNPAVSIAMAVSMHVSPTRALFYILAQCAGGIVGSLILRGVTPPAAHNNLGLTEIHPEIDVIQGVTCEAIFTFILVFSIYGCTDSNRPMFGSPAVGIGLTIAVVHLAAIPFTGASMNPARSLGSSVISNSYSHHWVYWVGPILGGILASLLYKFLFNPYRGAMSYEDAIEKMIRSDDVLPVPKQFFNDFEGGFGGKYGFEKSNLNFDRCCSHL